MKDVPVELDRHRGIAAQKSTEVRRRKQKVRADQDAIRARQEEFEKHSLALPARTFRDVAVKAAYLLELYAATTDASDPRRQLLIARVREELSKLSD